LNITGLNSTETDEVITVIEESFEDILSEESEANVVRIGDTILNQFRRLRLLQTGNATDVEISIVTNFECENENSCNVETDLQTVRKYNFRY
jgi:hypothetical protein